MKTKLLEIHYCVECPHCNGFFFCAKLGEQVDEIPENCPLQSTEDKDHDTARLNFLEQQAKISKTGISFDYVLSHGQEDGGFRFMRYHKLHERKKDIRAAIDEALFVFNPNKA